MHEQGKAQSERPLAGRRVAVGVGGGIAAYRVADVLRELGRRGAQVRVSMTPAAEAFITPLTLQSLSGHPVLRDCFEVGGQSGFGHLELARWAELFLVAPATADLIARIRAGMGNDSVTTALLAHRGPVLLAPAMNTAMWENPITQENVAALTALRRFHVVGPGVGALADGDVGAGRLAEVAEVVAAVEAVLGAGRSAAPTASLDGKRVLVSAGPTREPIDPVRFLSNPSSGKMGLALADEAAARGARVTLVLGPVTESVDRRRLDVVDVVTADEMAQAVLSRVDEADFFVSAAAVSDWRPAEVLHQKQKKSSGALTLALVPTTDILATASSRVHRASRRPVLVGFAAETHDVEAHARAKLRDKRLDAIVANDVSRRDAGFAADVNEVLMLGADGRRDEASGSKRAVAVRVWDFVESCRSAQRGDDGRGPGAGASGLRAGEQPAGTAAADGGGRG